ncbi:MAG TPA: FAD binding domain-containing protein [Candidatus Limnocylindria bacterium]|nr:FAD binding domain-containing protein [Candidatus Limnocylindria bacterium]
MTAVEPPLTAPRSLEEALALMAEASWRPIAGGTDLLVQLTGELGEPPERMLDLWRLDELRGIAHGADGLMIGALTTYAELRRSPIVAEFLPALAEAAATIGAAQIQNRGTVGGNIVNASPAGDTLPIWLATDAEFVLGSLRGERRIPAGDFWPAYRRTARADDELVLRVRVPLPVDRQLRFRKVGTRRAQAISKVVMAVAWRSGDTPDAAWTDVRVALGSMAATPIRATAAEAALEGAIPDAAAAERAVAALDAELRPIDDVRSTADYRRAVAGRVLRRIVRDEGAW